MEHIVIVTPAAPRSPSSAHFFPRYSFVLHSASPREAQRHKRAFELVEEGEARQERQGSQTAELEWRRYDKLQLRSLSTTVSRINVGNGGNAILHVVGAASQRPDHASRCVRLCQSGREPPLWPFSSPVSQLHPQDSGKCPNHHFSSFSVFISNQSHPLNIFF